VGINSGTSSPTHGFNKSRIKGMDRVGIIQGPYREAVAVVEAEEHGKDMEVKPMEATVTGGSRATHSFHKKNSSIRFQVLTMVVLRIAYKYLLIEFMYGMHFILVCRAGFSLVHT